MKFPFVPKIDETSFRSNLSCLVNKTLTSTYRSFMYQKIPFSVDYLKSIFYANFDSTHKFFESLICCGWSCCWRQRKVKWTHTSVREMSQSQREKWSQNRALSQQHILLLFKDWNIKHDDRMFGEIFQFNFLMSFLLNITSRQFTKSASFLSSHQSPFDFFLSI